MRWIDMAAMLVALVGVCLFIGIMVVMAFWDFAKLVSSHWSKPQDRWLVIIVGLAIVWIAVRWKKLSA